VDAQYAMKWVFSYGVFTPSSIYAALAPQPCSR
jgi:hypothetical protein